jgi:hypothetical protein
VNETVDRRTLSAAAPRERHHLLHEAIAKQMMAAPTFDPQRVADAIVRLVELPAGSRPLRTTVGDDAAAMCDPVNAITGPIAEGMFKAFGFI